MFKRAFSWQMRALHLSMTFAKWGLMKSKSTLFSLRARRSKWKASFLLILKARSSLDSKPCIAVALCLGMVSPTKRTWGWAKDLCRMGVPSRAARRCLCLSTCKSQQRNAPAARPAASSTPAQRSPPTESDGQCSQQALSVQSKSKRACSKKNSFRLL